MEPNPLLGKVEQKAKRLEAKRPYPLFGKVEKIDFAPLLFSEAYEKWINITSWHNVWVPMPYSADLTMMLTNRDTRIY